MLGNSREQKIHIRRDICNNKNHPFGYGVFTGAAEAMDFIKYGEIALSGNEIILLASDGLDPIFPDHFIESKIIEPLNLIDIAETLEDADQAIRSDDKSVIIIKVSDNLF